MSSPGTASSDRPRDDGTVGSVGSVDAASPAAAAAATATAPRPARSAAAGARSPASQSSGRRLSPPGTVGSDRPRDGGAAASASGVGGVDAVPSAATVRPGATGGDEATAAERSGSDEGASSDLGADVTDVGRGQGLSEAELRRRLRAAIDRAHVKAGRLSNADKAAAETLAVLTARAVRKARMQAAAPASRFPWRHVVRPHSAPVASPLEALTSVCGDEDRARQLLQHPEQPAAPPEPEAEAKGDDGGTPDPLPRSTAWWHEERARQAASPFQAGTLTEVRLDFRPGERPVPPDGEYLRWGQVLRTADLSDKARADLAKLLAKDLRSGAISLVQESDVDCVTPIFIVYHPVTLKARLVHDLRAVNARLVASSAHVPRITEALTGLPYAAKLDLAQAFRHVGIVEQDRRVMAFQVDDLTFRWNALPFGASQSPALFAAALASCLSKLPPSIKLVVYVDDILILGETRDQLDANVLALCQQLRGGGWSVALDKTFPYAHATVPFLGLLVSLGGEVQHLLVSRAKAERLHALCSQALTQTTVSLRDIQRITGLLAFFGLAAPEAKLGRKGLDAAAAEAEGLPGRTVGVKGECRADLEFWNASALSLPDMPPLPTGGGGDVIVCSDAAGLPSLGFGGVAWTEGVAAPDIDVALGSPCDYHKKIRLDIKNGSARVFSGPLPTHAASMSSAALEVLAFRRVLNLLHARTPLNDVTVHWFCDSSSAIASASRWRAKSPGLARELKSLLEDVRRIGCRVTPSWVSRDLGWQPLADALSKVEWRRNSVEWSVSQQWFQVLCERVGWTPTLDLFAAEGNAVTSAYCTQYPVAGAWTDAFSRSWSGLRAWAFPPFSAAVAALRHLCRASDARLLIVVPRETRVPPRLKVVSSTPMPHDLRLCDAAGREAPGPCPTPLVLLDVGSPDFSPDD